MDVYSLTPAQIGAFQQYLQEEERSPGTVGKYLRDVEASVRILEALGCTARWEGENLVVDTAGLNGWTISDILMREMRSSAIFLGAILARCGRAEISYPGGCEA